MLATHEGSTHESPRVLVVEDEVIIGRDICRRLQDLGYVARGPALSSAEALSLASCEPTDLVLMDIKIQGGIDGIETAQLLRERFQLPIVYLTAHADSATLNRAQASAPVGYIIKPFTTDDIKVAVELGLQQHNRQKWTEEKERWWNAVLTSLGAAIIVCEEAGRIVFCNSAAEELLGNSGKQLNGRQLNEILRIRNVAEDPESSTSNAETQDVGGQRFSIGRIQREDGLEKVVLATITPIQSDQGAPQGSAVLLRDLAEFSRGERELRANNSFLSRSNEQLTALAHSLAHDLQEPLRMVTCYSKLLAREAEAYLNSSEQEYLETITEAGQRMERMLCSLVDYYSAEIAGSAAAVPVSAARSLSDALDNLKAAIAESDATIQTPSLPQVLAHPTALVQIFQNLIANAIKYRRQDSNPKIVINFQRTGDFYKFSVNDNGIGFDPDQAHQIFALFSRAHGTNRNGSGIGLATCRRLVEQYGGRIWCESRPGEGSHFFFTLPIAQNTI